MEKQFPIQSQRGAAPHPKLIPWSVAELAYSVYSGKYGKDQSLERLAERGGFGPGEMDDFLPGWRDRVDRIKILEEKLSKAKEKLKEIVEVDGTDAGVVYLSVEGPTVYNKELNCQEYVHEYFSPLGDALVNLYKILDS